MTQKLMTDREVAEYTGLSIWSINELRRRKRIPHLKLPSIRRYYYEKSAIDRWLTNLQMQSTQQNDGKVRR
ncbi:MAG: helix-turn-helix domain-containing protein [Peptococcia bacterium]|jgi:predicted DNA-binding transcriptional regulator AlpA